MLFDEDSNVFSIRNVNVWLGLGRKEKQGH